MGRCSFKRVIECNSSITKHISCSTSNPSVAFRYQHLLVYYHLFRNIQLMKNQLRPALTIFALLTIITGVIYPLLVTGVSQVLFPSQSNGSIITVNGKAAGSELIGQQFDDPSYFWGRVSAVGYNADLSSGSNYGPMNPALLEAVQARIDSLQAADPGNTLPIPVDLVTASASGLDPHISVAAALYQVHRVASARGLSEADVQSLVEQNTEGRQFGIFGEPRVNVLKLNLALDRIN
jgi:potassium-transporting ATPase KdpC subunit